MKRVSPRILAAAALLEGVETWRGARVGVILSGGNVDLDDLSEPIEQRSRHLDADSRSIRFADVVERPLDLATQVPGDPVRSLRHTKRPLVRDRSSEGLQPRREVRFAADDRGAIGGQRREGDGTCESGEDD